MSITHDWNDNSEEDPTNDFDEQRWEDLINSDELCTEQFSKSIHTVENSLITINKNGIAKSSNLSKVSTFFNSNKFISTGRLMTILIPPSTQQRVRYENECKKILRYISVPNHNILTIKIPDLRDILAVNDAIWLRITRTTINHRKDGLIFYHPYPIWIKNKNTKIHNGSIFIQVTDVDIENGFIKIDTLAMIRLKQEVLATINTLAIYSPTQLDFIDLHSIDNKIPKRIRDEYQLRQSILNFQLVRVDQNNFAYLTDCLCQTESIHETEANERQEILKLRKVKAAMCKRTNKRQKT